MNEQPVLQTDIRQQPDRHKILKAIGLCRVRLVLVAYHHHHHHEKWPMVFRPYSEGTSMECSTICKRQNKDNTSSHLF